MRIDFGIGIGFDRDGNTLTDVEDRIHTAIGSLSRVFGGCFLTRGHGGWVDNDGKLWVEPGVVFHVDTDKVVAGRVDNVAEVLRQLFHQTAVHVTVFPDAVSHNQEGV